MFADTSACENFTAVLERSMVYENGDVWSSTMFFKSTQNAVETVDDGETRYFFIEDGQEYCYYLRENEWEKSSCDETASMVGKVMDDTLGLPIVAKAYEQLTYDAENDCYTGTDIVIYEDGWEHLMDELIVKIQDGKVVRVEITMLNVASGGPSGDSGSGVAVFSISDYNKTVVTLPQINEKTGLTKEEWDEVFANTIASDNFTGNYKSIVESEDSNLLGMNYEQTIKSSETAYILIENGVETYYFIEDGQEYCYYLEDGKWVKDLSIFPLVGTLMENACMMPIFMGTYDQLTYDVKNDCYIGKDVTVSIEGLGENTFSVLIVEIQNGKVSYVEYSVPMLGGYTEEGEKIVVGVQTAKMSLFDYGTTAVGLPEIEQNS